jgi:hypothetical protein
VGGCIRVEAEIGSLESDELCANMAIMPDHPSITCFAIPKLASQIGANLVAKDKHTLLSLARCCRTTFHPATDEIWCEMDCGLAPFVMLLPTTFWGRGLDSHMDVMRHAQNGGRLKTFTSLVGACYSSFKGFSSNVFLRLQRLMDALSFLEPADWLQ